eukprot:698451-Hanusia_phi.AAC.1
MTGGCVTPTTKDEGTHEAFENIILPVGVRFYPGFVQTCELTRLITYRPSWISDLNGKQTKDPPPATVHAASVGRRVRTPGWARPPSDRTPESDSLSGSRAAQ